jgi:beta-fructofuranosidase
VQHSRRKFLGMAGACGAMRLATPKMPSMRVPLRNDDQTGVAELAADPLRPQFHLLPARNWMNDPNGPIYWNGHYHMFFQYNPNAAVWGDMHWAHSVSPDMVHWRHLPVALSPSSGGPDQDGCFSGSAVDQAGTATILYTGVRSVLARDATLRDGRHNFLETQCLATSRDPLLLTWTKLPAPVLLPPRDAKLTGFRDPCLWQEGQEWYMGIGSGQSAEGGCVLLYRSTDLRAWEYVHPLASGKSHGKRTADPVDSGEMWECPDFFPLGKKRVLLYATERKVYWETGEYDRKEHVFYSEKRGLLDAGAFYAPKSQFDANERRILWGWIPETRPEAESSAAGWAGSMSLPRVLSLAADNTLIMQFLPELAELRTREFVLPGRPQGGEARCNALGKLRLREAACEIELQIHREKLDLTLRNAASPILSLAFDPGRSGAELRVGAKSAAVAAMSGGEHNLRIFLDASVAECIVDDRRALTERCYAVSKGPLRLNILEQGLDAITSLRVWELKPISKDRLTS